MGGGPRDLQRRQQQTGLDQSGVVEELKNEVRRLAEELKDRPVIGGFSGEQVDDEIRSAVTDAVKDFRKEMQKSNKKEEDLQAELKEKEKELEKLKNIQSKEIEKQLREHNDKLERLIRGTQYRDITIDRDTALEEIEKIERPKIEPVFIDPLEEGAGKELKPFLDVKDVSSDDKENMFDKVEKLKGMLGKLPTKK